MPGKYIGRRRRFYRKKYPGRPLVARINRSIYDADAFVRIQRTVPLTVLTALGLGSAQICMRSDIASSTAVDFTYLDQLEY